MSPLQKRVILTLAIANVLFLLLGIPSAFVLLNAFPEPTTQPPVAVVPTTATPSIVQAAPSPSATLTRARPTPVLEEGWKVYRVPALGLTIALPPTWETQELGTATLENTIRALRQKNPLMADALQEQGQQLIAAGVQFFAADLARGASSGQVITNITIIHQTQKQEFGFDFYLKANLQQLNEMEGATKPVASRRFQTEVGEMGQARYRMAMTGSNGQPLASAITQYMFLLGKESYLVTFTTPVASEDKYAPTFEKIAMSIRWSSP